ncbi:MAG: type II toxin-antitoxin system VapC family toxin [Rubrobacteraceae bacterium]
MSYPFRAAVLDTSVVVKWFIQEEDSDRAANLRHAHGRAELLLHAPDVLLMELANALRYSPLVSAEEIPQALRLFSGLAINVAPFDLNVLISASSLSLDHDLAVYDAYFLALAQALEIPLITNDRKMLSRLTPEDGALSLKDL